MTRQMVGIMLILVSIAIALDQVIRFGRWQWGEMLTLWHHEGVALAAFLVGAASLVRTLRLRT